MKRAFGLRAALAVLVLIAIAPVFGVVVQASLSEQQGRLARAQASLAAVVDMGAAHQERLIEGARQMLVAISISPPVYGDDLPACVSYMKKLQSLHPEAYGTFGLLDARGDLACRAVPPSAPVNSSDRLFFRRAVQTGHFAIGEFSISRASGGRVLTFGLPVFRESGELRGVAYLALDVGQADQQLRSIALSPDTTLLMLDAGGVLLASAGAGSLAAGVRVTEPFLRKAIEGGQAVVERASGSDGEEWLFALRPVGRPGEAGLFVAGMVSSAAITAPSERRLYAQLGAMALISLLAAVLAWMFGDRVVARPIARMVQRLNDMRRDELRLDLPPARGALELRQLDQGFQEMARTLVERSVQRDGAMAEMAGQKNLVESILESMAEGVVVIDRRGRVIHTNAAAHQIMPGLAGLSGEKDFARVKSQDGGLFHLDGVTPLAPAERPAVRALEGNSTDNYRHLARGALTGGRDKIIQGHGRPLLSPGGEQYGAVLVFSDITAAYRAEEALRDSERRYRALFESNPHPMWVYDLETLRFLTVNDAAVAHYGYSRADFLGMTIRDIRPAEDLQILMDAVDDGQTLHAPEPWRHRLRDGRIIYVEISSHALEYAGRRARIVLAHDITQRLLAQQALEHANENLEGRVEERTQELAISNRELESFAYSVSHDLRAPLQVIDGFGRALLAQYGTQLAGRGQHYLDRIRDNTRQMGELIDDLLSLARVTRAEIITERVNLSPKAAQIVERLRQRFPERQVAVDIDEAIHCRGDPRLLAVVLENLIENAWKFTGRTEGARIRIGRKPGEDGRTVVYVADNGAGFDMAYVGKLFNPFQRLHAVTDFEGTGIGLATVHRIVTRHGGRVWAESEPGQGAIFQFTLKAGASDEEQPDIAGRGQPRSPGTHPDDAGREQCAQ
ncbi:MAG TPA: PAS domain S-box protein [Ramlibacter sp.]|nr:PAS domain S-box protein [Ramlibacter sp.]